MDLSQLILYGLYSLPAVLLWGGIYYYKDPYRLKRKALISTFLLGMVAILPLFIYQYFAQSLYVGFLSHSLVGKLTQNPYLDGLIQFAITMLFLAVLVFVIVSLITLSLSWFRHEKFKNIYRATLEETTNFELTAIVIGVVVILETFVRLLTDIPVISSILGIIMIMAVLEEYIKHLVVRLFNDQRLKSVDHAIAFSIFVGLGFAFAENIYYLMSVNEVTWFLVLGRSLFSTFGHVLFSAIFGYYYGVAHFARPISFDYEVERQKLFELPEWAFKIIPLKKEDIFHEKKIAEGLLFSMGLHTLFNVFMAFNLVLLTPILFIFGYYVLEKIFKDKENKKNFGLIGTDIMPPGEYEKLVMQINAIKWAQQIKAEREVKEKQIRALQDEQKWYRKLPRVTLRLVDYVVDEKNRRDFSG